MKKYRLELSIGLIFALLLVALLWGNLAAIAPALPMGLLAACVVALISVIAPFPERDAEGKIVESSGERYAPKEFSKAVVWSVVGIAIIVGFTTLLNRERFTKTIDLSERKVNSLSDETVKVLNGLETQVQVFCVPAQDPRERYCDESMHLRTLYAETSPKFAHTTLNLMDKGALAQVQPSGYSRLVLLTESGGRNELIGTVTESKLTNEILKITKTKRRVYFLTGSGEHPTSMEGTRNYAMVAEVLRNRAYEVVPLKLTDALPEDAQILVAGPAKAGYSLIAENMFRRLLARGGRVILVLNPHRESGMPTLFNDLGIKLDSNLLISNVESELGGRLAEVNRMRPPLAVGEFSRQSPITSSFDVNTIGLADGARPLLFEAPTVPAGETAAMTVKGTVLLNAIYAAPVTLTEEQRNRLPLEGDLRVTPNAGFDSKKTYPVGLSVEIENPAKLAEGVPTATMASNDLKTSVNVGNQDKNSTSETNESKANDKAAQEKLTAELVLFSFDTVAYERVLPTTANLIPMAVAHLYKDKDLISIPHKDFAPRKFKLERNPQSFVLLFAFLLPILTAISGFYIYARRRSA